MKNVFAVSAFFLCAAAFGQPVNYGIDASVGAVNSIRIEGDKRDMNWVLRAGQRRFITAADQWGLGKFTQTDIYGFSKTFCWQTPVKQRADGGSQTSVYCEGGLRVEVLRKILNGNLAETYRFTNVSPARLAVGDIAVNAPFNDYYEKSDVCLDGRAHTHIWADGGHSAYVCALNMAANPPHLGLVMTRGALCGYEVNKRSKKTGMSNFRGVIALRLAPFALEPNASAEFSWTLFAHSGWEDFFEKAKALGAVVARFETSPTAVLGEKLKVVFSASGKIKNPRASVNGKPIEFETSIFSNDISVSFVPKNLGEYHILLEYGDGKRTSAVANVVENPAKIIAERADFILRRQQMNNPLDRRFGAYMVFDNVENRIYLNDDARKANDVDEGAERLGMGIFLARLCRLEPREDIRASLGRYAAFVRGRLQTPDYTTYSTTFQNTRNRFFNYPWAARFYFEMYRLTKDAQYLAHAAGTMKSFYRQFGHARYTLDTPVYAGVNALRAAGMNAVADALFADFKKSAQIYLDRGVDYPKQEVDYEQSIVAPAAMHLLEMYLLTSEPKWLDGAKLQLQKLEAFDGRQPHYRLFNIPIRHWDAYWFGKRRIWGDTFPHYWAGLSAMAYAMYADASGDASYRAKAENITRSCLSLFYGGGRATCAYVFPDKVDGFPCKIADEFANDQDWALAFYLMVLHRDY